MEVLTIHRQLAYCAKAPPMTGPVTLPIAHIPPMIPTKFPRYRRGTKSVTTISVMAIMPPPPTPCSDLPVSSNVKLLARAAIRTPIKKNVIAINTIGLRPKMWLKDA
jgi:hypothetical protein